MVKKIVVFLCFFAGATCFISAGLYINRQNAGLEPQKTEETVSKVKSPELLSEIDMTSYVSLPESFSDIDITEDLDNIEVTDDNVQDVMYEQLDKTADRLGSVQLDSNDNITLIVDYTVTQKGKVKEVKSNFKMAYSDNSKIYNDDVYTALNNAKKGDTVRVTDTTFNGVEDASVDITISDILNMPYPVTDDYIQNNTEYDSVHDMCSALKNDASGEAKEIAREHTINSLIDTMMEQTTFIQLPESLIQRELEVLQKDDPNATYEQAKHSLYKVFFIASVIKNDGVATKTDLEKRYEKLDKSEKEGLSKYEIERKKYLLFEEDVVTSIYKKVQINSQESSTGDSDAAEIDNTENDDNSIE